MILNKIMQTPELFSIMRSDVSENGVSVTFDPALLDDEGNLRHEKVCILKLDDYVAYNSLSTHNPPKVIDSLVVVKCCDGLSTIYLVELRKTNGRRPIKKRLRPVDIQEKFKTAIDDFIGIRYREIFSTEVVKEVKAYLVADPWRLSGREDAQDLFNKKLKLSALDAYSSQKPLRVLGRNILISPVLPPNPVISSC